FLKKIGPHLDPVAHFWTPLKTTKTPRLRGFCAIGETGFEPATARPPAGCATRLRYSPWCGSILRRTSERATGVEPVPRAWKAPVQPLTPRPQVGQMVAGVPLRRPVGAPRSALGRPWSGPQAAKDRTSCRGRRPA